MMYDPLTKKTVWLIDSEACYFIIPDGTVIPQGSDVLTDLHGKQCMADKQALTAFFVSPDEALSFLKLQYTDQISKTKKALMELNVLAAKTGKNDPSFIDQMIKDGWSNVEQTAPFAIGKDIVEGLLGHVRETGKTTEEQQADFMKLFGRVPEITKFFDEKTLAEAAKNPEKWAAQMNEKFFGEEEAAKRKARTEKLKREVQESIARGLRNAGIEPIPPENKDNE